jgi:hypothetical protein
MKSLIFRAKQFHLLIRYMNFGSNGKYCEPYYTVHGERYTVHDKKTVAVSLTVHRAPCTVHRVPNTQNHTE